MLSRMNLNRKESSGLVFYLKFIKEPCRYVSSDVVEVNSLRNGLNYASINPLTHFTLSNIWHIMRWSMDKKRFVLGESDFQTLITGNCYYADKTLFIKDVVEGSKVLLFARPRRFGKTLNLTMLRHFFDINGDCADLFANLKISNEKQIMEMQGKHPVIYLTLKDVKGIKWETCYNQLKAIIVDFISDFDYLLESEFVKEKDKAFIQRILARNGEATDYTNSLKILSKALYLHHKIRPIILIDEYDTPIHEGYESGYYKEIIGFMRSFLGGVLKDDKHIEKAVLTGILRIAKESMFSGLNNLEVCTINKARGADKFGFTEPEVAELLEHCDNMFSLEEIRQWYDGYNFAGAEIYNPWSILSSVVQKELTRHWVNTSGNDLLKELCLQADESIKQELDLLCKRATIHKVIDDNIVFDELGRNQNALWSFLLHTGYLRYDNMVEVEDNGRVADLRFPNYEVFSLFNHKIVKQWFTPQYKDYKLAKITNHLISGDLEAFKTEFQQYCLSAISYYDISGNNPEKLYHIFLLGMLSSLNGPFQVKSNREAGLGRSDVMLIPKDRSKVSRGIIFEFKKVNKRKKETFEDKIEEAKEQIVEKKYAEELRGFGVREVVCIIMVFSGKEVRVEIVHNA